MARILIVSDRSQAAQDLKNIVRQFGHYVVGIAGSSDEALQLASRFGATIAFVDILFMRDQGAIDVATKLRQSANVRIIFATAQADPEIMSRVDELRPDGYILEPYAADAVFNALSSALQRVSEPPLKPTALEQVTPVQQTWNELPTPIMLRVENYVQANLDGEISLRGLADICGMSESSFSRRFKATRGQTPYQFVMSARLAEAKRLLKDTSLPLVDVAVATGFSSQSHFATTFKKAMNQTPLQYRRG